MTDQSLTTDDAPVTYESAVHLKFGLTAVYITGHRTPWEPKTESPRQRAKRNRKASAARAKART